MISRGSNCGTVGDAMQERTTLACTRQWDQWLKKRRSHLARGICAFMRFGSAAMAVAATLTTAAFGAEIDEPLLIDLGVQEQVTSLLKGYKPSTQLMKLTEVRDTDIGGKLLHYEVQSNFSRQETGLWAVVAVGGFTSGSGATTSQYLSLCGLITLVRSDSFSAKLDTTTAIPFGRIFVPFGIRSIIDVWVRARVKEFRTTHEGICSPVAGATFTYQIKSEVQTKTSGMFGRTRITTTEADATCTVAKEANPAKQLSSSFHGDFLGVSCEIISSSGQKSTVDSAFLVDSGIYLTLNESSPTRTMKVQFTTVEYGE